MGTHHFMEEERKRGDRGRNSNFTFIFFILVVVLVFVLVLVLFSLFNSSTIPSSKKAGIERQANTAQW